MKSLLRVLGVVLGLVFCAFGAGIIFGLITASVPTPLHGLTFVFVGLYFLLYGATGESSVVALFRNRGARK